MNKVFKVIWNTATQSWVAVSELQKAKGKSKTKSISLQTIAVSAALAGSTLIGGQALAAVAIGATTGNTIDATGATAGTDSIAIGNAKAPSDGSVAIGVLANATGLNSYAAGREASALGAGSTAIGYQANATANNSVAIGEDAFANGTNSYAMGSKANGSGNNSIAIGPEANTTANRAVALGFRANALATTTTAIGYQAKASDGYAQAFGANATASAVNATAIGRDTTASALNATAIGTNSNATLDNALAIGTLANSSGQAANAMGLSANASGTNSFAMGTRANASAESTYAIGTDAVANNTKSIAIGSESKSSGDKSISIGDRANASNFHAIAIGAASQASGNTSMALGDQAIASSNYSFAAGGLANATANYSTAIGANANATGEFSTALGKSATATGRMGTALGINTNATGQNATAVGSNATAAGAGGLAMGLNATAGSSTFNNAIAIGTNSSSVSGHSSIATGTNATASNHNAIATGTDSKAQQQGSIAIGQNATSANIHALALGTNATANLDRSVALGAYSTVSAAVQNPNDTFNGITYNFAGGTPQAGDVVSVGSADRKRQIQNVAAGQISDVSTDAINGSQLYSVITESHWKLQANGAAVGDVNFGDKVNFKSADGSVTITPTAEANGVSTLDLQIKRGLGINLDSNGALAVANTKLDQSATTMRFSTPRGQQNSFVKADDLARHLNDVGFRLSGEAQGGSFEDMTTAVGERQLRTGDTLTMIAGPNMHINQVNKGFEFSVEGENVAYAGNKATVPTTDEGYVATVKSVAEAINHAGFTLKTSAATGGEKVSGTDEVINPADIVDMTAGKNLTVKQDANGKITYATKNEVEFDKVTTNNLTVNPNGDVNMGGNTINNVGSGGDTDTNAANISDVKNARTVVTSNDGTVTINKTTDGLQDTYDLSVNASVPTTTLTTNKGNVETPAQPDSYVTAGNLATTINNAVASAKEKVVAGTNIASVDSQVDDATGATTFTVNAKGATASAGSDKVTVTPTAKDGNITDYAVDLSQAAKDSLNKADTAVQSFTTAVKGATVDTINQQNTVINFVDGVGTTATAKDGDITFDVKKADLTTDTAGNVTNDNAGDTFVTGDDVADAINKATELTEKTTTVVAGKNTHVQNKVDGNNTEYTVSADKSTVSVSSALTKTETPTTDATTGAVTTDYALDLSQTTKDDIKKGVDAKDIVDNKGLTFTGDSGSTDVKKLGSTVAVNGDDNITTEATADAINIKLNKDINVDSVTANTVNVGPVTINNDGIDAGNKTITNVANGTAPNDAVNVSQLNAAKTEVTGSGLANVTSTTGNNGQTIYNVDVAKADAPTVTRGNVEVKQGDENKVMTAGDVANAINGSEKTSSVKAGSDKVTVQAGTEDDKGNTEYTVDLSADVKAQIAKEESVTAGNNNLTVEQDVKNATGGNNYKVTLSNNLDLGNTGSVKTGDTTVNNDGVTINNGNTNNSPVSLTKNGLDNGGNKITNVANGTAPTDAVNVSQLQTQTAASKEEVKSEDQSVTVNTTKNADGANVYDLSVNVDDTTITKTADGKLTANTTSLKDDDTDGKVDEPQGDDAKKLVNAGDIANAINNSGWKAKSGGNKAAGDQADETLINPSEVVEFNAGNNLEVKRVDNVFTFETKKEVVFDKVTVGPVTIDKTDGINAGNKQIKGVEAGTADTDAVNVSQLKSNIAESKWTLQTSQDNAAVSKVGDINPDDKVTIDGKGVVKVTNTVEAGNESKVHIEVETQAMKVENGTATTEGNSSTNNAAPNPDALATVGDIIDVVNNVSWSIHQNADPKVNDVKAGNEVHFVDSDEFTAKVTADGTTKTNVTFSAKTTQLKDENNDGKVDAPNTDDTKKLVNAGDIANAINNSGFKAKANGDAGELINPGDEVDFIDGSNIAITRDGGKFTVATKKDVTFDSVTFGDNGPKITNNGGNINVGGPNGAPVKITNVADGDVTADSKDAVNGSQLYTQVAASKEEVKSDDKSVTVTTTQNAAGANVYDLSVNVDGTTITKGDNGELKANTTTLADADTDGKVDDLADDKKGNLITAGDVATAINASGFKAKANGDAGELINPGDEVDFINGSNIEITREGGKFTVATKKDVTFDSVTFGDNGPKITNNGGNINVAGNDGSPTKITGVKAGEADTDAVNVSQLEAAKAAATTKVKGDQGVTVTSEDNADGSKTYTVAAKTDNTTVKVDDNGNIAAVTSDLTNNPEGKVNAPAAPNALVTAQTVTDAINNAGFNLQANGDAKSLVKTGDTVQFLNGDNIVITRNGNDIKVGTTKEVTFDKVTVGPVTINKDSGIDAGDTKITGVKAGTDANDAVNVSQLNNQIAASKEVVKSDDKSVTVVTTQNAEGANVFDLSVNTDDVTITKTPDGKVTANTTSLDDADNDGKVDAPNADDAKKLVNAGDIATAINKAGFKLKTSANGGDKLSGNDELINAGDMVDMAAGKNLTVKQEANGKVTYATKDDVTFNTVNSTTVVVGNPADPAKSTTLTSGDKGLDVGGDKITNVADGDISPTSTDVVNGSQLNNYTKVNGQNIGTDNGAINIVNGNGTTVTSDKAGELKVNVNSTDLTVADNGTINVQDPNGTGSHFVNATTVAKAVNNVSWNVNSEKDEATANAATKNTYTAGNNKVKAGDTVKVNAGRNVEISGSGKNINVAVSDNPEFNTVKVGKGNNATTISSNEDGVRVAKADGSPQRITNVAAGRNDTDAVNVGQLKGAVTNLNNKINRNNREARAGIAGSNAAAALPQVYIPGKSMVAAAGGTFKGENALAVGYSRSSDNGKLILKLQGNANSRGDIGGGVGVGYQW